MSSEKEISEFPMVQDKVRVFHTRKTEQGEIISTKEVTAEVADATKRVESLKDELGKPHFCIKCGELIAPILVLSCENKECGQQFILEYDEVLKKIIILPIDS
jgi:hypothetical protein